MSYNMFYTRALILISVTFVTSSRANCFFSLSELDEATTEFCLHASDIGQLRGEFCTQWSCLDRTTTAAAIALFSDGNRARPAAIRRVSDGFSPFSYSRGEGDRTALKALRFCVPLLVARWNQQKYDRNTSCCRLRV